MNIVQLNDILGTVCMKVPTVHSYYGEDIYEAWNTTEVKYASMAFNLENTRQTDHTRTFEGVLYFADRLTEDKSNCLGIYADADNAIANVLTNLQDATDEGEFSISEYQIVHFQQKFADFLAGGYARIQITVANTCDIVLLTEKVSTIIILEENGEYDVSSYSTAIVAVPPYGEEHDPIFCASAAYTIEATDIRLWNYTADYLNSYVSKSELVHCGYITNADLPDYSNTYQAKGNYVTPEIMSAASYVTHDYLSAQSYLTYVEFPDYSNTYQAKGDYVTPTDLDNAAYITANDLPDYSNTYQAKGDYVTPTELSAQAYITAAALPDMTAYVSKSELGAAAYITANDLPDYSNTYQAKGDYITPTDLDNAAYITAAALPDMTAYVSKSELGAAAYITANDLPDYSNTYQAKGNYLTQETDPIFTASVAATITQSDIDNWNRGGSIDLSSYVTHQYLSAQSYATNARLSEVELVSTKAISYVYDRIKHIDLSSYVSKSELSAQSYVTSTQLKNLSYVTQATLTAQSYVTQASLSSNSYVTQASLSLNSYITSAQFVFDASTATLHITL